MSKPATHGGPRPGAGRPRKGEQPRVTISFSVDQSCKKMAADLRREGLVVSELVEFFIAHTWAAVFGGCVDYQFMPGEKAITVKTIIKGEREEKK